MNPLARSLGLLRGRPALVLVAGALLAVVTEAGSIGLLGLSGWFVAQCYLAGLDPRSTFSYLAPSGVVRALALTRIGGRYVERLVTHTATLQWSTRLRVRMFLDVAAAGPEKLRRLRTGEALDRAMSDADTLDGILIRTFVPVVVAVAGLAGTAVVIASYSAAAAATLAVGAGLTAAAAVAAGAPDAGGDSASPAAARGRARAEVIAAVDAWAEMISLGAVDQLRRSAVGELTRLQQRDVAAASRHSRGRSALDLCAGLTTTSVLAVAVLARPALALPDAVLVVLLVAGALELAGALPEALRSGRDAALAARRLDDLASARTDEDRAPRRVPPTGSAAGLPVSVGGLPLAPVAGPAVPRADLAVAAGELVVVTGASGSGKTTLLRALAGDAPGPEGEVLVDGRPPRHHAPGAIVLVADDDHVFSGTVADNLRLADPGLEADAVEDLLAAMALAPAGVHAATRVGAGGRALSGGEVRRLCLARAVASRPGLLLLDEPTEGLDAATARTVFEQLRRLLPATTIIAAVHDRQSTLPPTARHVSTTSWWAGSAV